MPFRIVARSARSSLSEYTSGCLSLPQAYFRGGYPAVFRQQGRPPDNRSQLPYVSRPRISLQPFLCLAIKAFHVPFQLPVGGIQHELRQRYNVFGTLCQQWYMQRKLVQTVEQVFPGTVLRLSPFPDSHWWAATNRMSVWHFFPAAYRR